MSPAQISDIELDRLLDEVPTPPPPARDLADRIAARALRTPQDRAHRLSPRQAPRRRAALWTAVVVANLMAAAAAAASWDGKAFDFHRLTELPHRVAAAIYIRHHPPVKELAAPRKSRPVVVLRAVVKTPVVVAPLEAVRAPVTTTATPRMPQRQRIHGRLVERPRVVEPGELRVQQAIRLHALQHRSAAAPRRIARVRPTEPWGSAMPTLPPRSQRSASNPARDHERPERSTVAAERRQAAVEINAPVPTAADIPLSKTTPQDLDNGRRDVRRRRFGWWPTHVLKREHVRETRNRFRRRF